MSDRNEFFHELGRYIKAAGIHPCRLLIQWTAIERHCDRARRVGKTPREVARDFGWTTPAYRRALYHLLVPLNSQRRLDDMHELIATKQWFHDRQLFPAWYIAAYEAANTPEERKDIRAMYNLAVSDGSY